MTAIVFAAKSKNAKIKSSRGKGEVSTTYAPISVTCPSTCELRKSRTCYAMGGMVGFVVSRIEKAAVGLSRSDAAKQEAAAIRGAFSGGNVPQDGARGGRDLRVHTSGDCSTRTAAALVGAACADWRRRGGGDAWTYTHAWKSVTRVSWGTAVSVLASLDSLADAAKAVAAGYAPARVVPSFPNGNKSWTEAGVRWIPCPAQTREDTGCADCRLCFGDRGLAARNSGIAFAAHGMRANALKKHLAVVS